MMTGSWTSGPSLNFPRGGLASAVAARRIYAIGGNTTGFADFLNSVEVLLPGARKWRLAPPMSTRRANPGAATCGRNIYVFGGFDSDDHITTTAERLRVGGWRGRRWRAIEALPEQTSGPGVATLGGQIYIVGGATSNMSSVRIYDPRRDRYTDAPPMPTARFNLKATVLGGLLYAIGGISGNDGTFLSTVERYNPTTQAWQTVAPMNEKRGNPAVVTARGRIYVVGGAARSPKSGLYALDTAEVYDPTRNSWTMLRAQLSVGRGSLCGERRGRNMLAVGGFELPNPPFSASTRVEVLKR